MKHYPALDVTAADIELLYSALDDFPLTAIEERADGLRAFFVTAADRDTALRALATRFTAAAIEVPDEDWARRSQEGLQPITIGRLTIVPRPLEHTGRASTDQITIIPSMGFGTGHHATTRLCLLALQAIDIAGKTVIDVGTGSGVLAIAARVLGAARAYGIDSDPDAIQSAVENLALNPRITDVVFEAADLSTAALRPADIVVANLTGALLVRAAAVLLEATAAGGRLVLSGLMRSERDEVVAAFASGRVVWEQTEDEWVGLMVKKP